MTQPHNRQRSFRISKPSEFKATAINFRSQSKTSLPSNFCQDLLNRKVSRNFRITQATPRRNYSIKQLQPSSQKEQIETEGASTVSTVASKMKSPRSSSLLERRGIITEIQKIYFHLNLEQTNFDLKPTVQATRETEKTFINSSRRCKQIFEKLRETKIQKVVIKQNNFRKMSEN